MLNFAQLSLLCLCFSLTLGCSGTPSAPAQEETDKSKAAMEADMKTMMQQVPRKPK
jgi:Tfp pilus assembly protein PilF